MKDLNNLYYLTDLYFFEQKQALTEFDKHYKFFTSDKDKDRKKINKQKLFDYFIKGIASGTKTEVDGDKMGFFQMIFSNISWFMLQINMNLIVNYIPKLIITI